MARSPHIMEDPMEKLRLERQERFNRIIGCAFLGFIGAMIVALIIGYWATH